MKFPKPTRWKSKKYEQWIKTQPCLWCGNEAEPHHLKGVGNLSGGAVKAPSWAVMPLCHKCHMQMHDNPERWPEQWEMVARTIGSALDAGVIK